MSTNTRTFIIEVIERYKAHQCLWKIHHQDYRDREKRDEAMKDLLQFFKTKDPEANLDTVKKKISTLRNCFRKEHNKVKASLKSSSGTGEMHIPKLWYYTEMLFLVDEYAPLTQSDHSVFIDMQFENGSEISDYESEGNISTNDEIKFSPVSHNSVDSSSRIKSKRKSKSPNDTDYVVAKIAKKLDEPPRPKQQFDSFGEHIAEKLRNLPSLMATYCQKVINDAIFMAETNRLTIDSHIVNKD
ncbi:uncharacterized protein LOC121731992 [Aricia agestis]|uniref:uncharacterized protein LOC121731992 n=1 Tax=Aricia agestis TaxID=91739 RepID=UPI001C206D84|nr:uncharacterized protein LOC121731992 [Aricia agestis]